MIRINLLPVREERRRAQRRQHGMFLVAFAIAGIVVCLGLEFAISARISSERERIAEAQAEKKRLQATLDEVNRYRSEEEEIRRKLGVIERLERGRTGPATAGQRLPFDAALPGPEPEGAVGRRTHQIDVGPRRTKARMTT